jgi:hypothetical protein
MLIGKWNYCYSGKNDEETRSVGAYISLGKVVREDFSWKRSDLFELRCEWSEGAGHLLICERTLSLTWGTGVKALMQKWAQKVWES